MRFIPGNRFSALLISSLACLALAAQSQAATYLVDNFESYGTGTPAGYPVLASSATSTPWLKLGTGTGNLTAITSGALAGSQSAQTVMNLAGGTANGSVRKNLGSAGVNLSDYVGGTATIVAKTTSATAGGLSIQFSIAGTTLADGTTIPSYFSTTAQAVSTTANTYTFNLTSASFTTGTAGSTFANVMGAATQVGIRITGTSGVASTNTLVIDSFQLNAVPEPTATAALMGVAGVCGLRRKRSI